MTNTQLAALECDQALVNQAIQTCKQGDIRTALELFAEAIRRDNASETAWLWLSGLVDSDGERRFCLNRVLQINPQSVAAQHGLKRLPCEAAPQPPTQARDDMVECCVFPGCRAARRASSTYCFGHWMAIYRPALRGVTPTASAAEPQVPVALSAAALAEKLNVATHTLLAVCAELGWIERGEQGWLVTAAGKMLGAVQQRHPQSGVPYVHWPPSVLDHPALPRALRHIRSADAPAPARGERMLREQQPPRHRAIDGHVVRLHAELLIDNWLYNANFVHAYERVLPAEEECFCDFYLPTRRIYIEYCGRERDEQMLARMPAKHAIYERLRLNFIALNDDHVEQLDICMPVLLAQFAA